jgi:murein DD-endopeptidase MepM/ murein hydrolase activator NlpD
MNIILVSAKAAPARTIALRVPRLMAGGVVPVSDFRLRYGNMSEVDHGNGLDTRDAHLSGRDANVGDVLLSGGRTGEAGTTGPHLHFEVR